MSVFVDELARQRALDTYHLVDSLPEAAYDDITRVASALCGVPIALISLIDRDRQWFKARTGLAATQTRRDEAFCDHAIREPDRLMEVPDALGDARFVDNPLVTGELGIRFYAGMPLVTPGGAPIGTVCVIDREPRELNEAQREGLASLARLTMNLMEARHRERELERAAFLASAVPEPVPVAPSIDHSAFTVAIFEVQDLAGAGARLGERAAERVVLDLENALHDGLRPGSGDSASRATGSAEVIVVLHGKDVGDALQRLQERVFAFERETGLHVLSGHADSEAANERVESVFLRADIALSQQKDVYWAGLTS
ncbi:GAF domain-containing protein [Arenimonas oryziterrae]|nr:GAF domain-containing protein [Arenimonas oryziterrae]